MQSGIPDIQNYFGILTANTFRYLFYIKESTNTRDRNHPVYWIAFTSFSIAFQELMPV